MKKIFMLSLVFCLMIAMPCMAKKNKKTGGLKKILAVGHVDTTQIRYSSMNTTAISELLQDKIRKELEGTGRYSVVIPKETEADEEEENNIKSEPAPTTAAEIMKYSAKMQKQMEKMMNKAQGKYNHVPVAAGSLFTFILQRGEKSMGTGTALNTAEDLTGANVGSFDFSSDTVKLTLTCIQRDPLKGSVVDQHMVQTSSSSLRSFRDMMFYTTGDSSDRDRAFNNMFEKAVSKCVKWMDGKLEKDEWKGEVIQKRGSEYIINAGQHAGVKENMNFGVYKVSRIKGKGVDLGAEEIKKGSVEIVSVKDKYSVAKITEGQIKVGDIIKEK